MLDKKLNPLSILYADISGSTKLYETFGDDIARADVKVCVDLMTKVTKEWNGEVVKTIGDEVMCAFADPSDAANAAREMHLTLQEASDMGKFQSGKIKVKIGWHFGKVEYRDNEIIGEAPVTAQQVIKLAKGEEILTTSQSIQAINDDLKEGSHPVDIVEAEAWSGKLEVYSMAWEEEEDATTFAGAASDIINRKASLILTYKGQELVISDENTHVIVGRGDDNDLVVLGRYTSRHHAEINFRYARFSLVDKSTNGTFVIDREDKMKRVHREEAVITGNGTICFGGPPDTDPEAAVSYRCEQ